MKRILKYLLLGTLAVAVLVGGLLVWAVSDESFLSGQVERYVERATGRELVIGGLVLDPGRRTRVRVESVRLANADWAGADPFLEIDSGDLMLDFSGIFNQGIVVEQAALSGVRLNLAQDDTGRANWNIKQAQAKNDEPGAESVQPLVAWSRMQLTDFELTHISPERSVPLEFRIEELIASHRADGRVEMNGNGVVGGYDLALEGHADPLHAVRSGGPLTFGVKLDLGEIHLISEGSMDNARTGAGARVHLDFNGPEISWLLQQGALPKFATGPFNASARLDLGEDGAPSLSLNGDFGNLDVRVGGRFDRLDSPSEAQFSFEVSGPDLEALGQAFGTTGLPASKYQTQGEVGLEGEAITLKRFSARVGQSELDIRGSLGNWPEMAGVELELQLDTPDISAIAGTLHDGLPNLPGYFEGTVERTAGGLTFNLDNGKLGTFEFTLDGNIPRFPLLDEARSEFSIAVPSLNAIESMTGLTGLPGLPVEISGAVSRIEGGWKFERVGGRLGGGTLEAEGDLLLDPHLAARNMAVSLQGEDFRAFYDDPWLDGLPGRFSLHIQGDTGENVLRMGQLKFGLGQAELVASGTVGFLQTPPILDFDVHASVPDPAEFSAFINRFGDIPLPGGPARLEGALLSDGAAFALSDAVVEIGKSSLAGEISFEAGDIPEMKGTLQSGRLDLRWMFANVEEEGATQNAAERARPGESPTRVFPDEPLPILGWDPVIIDLDVSVDEALFPATRLVNIRLGLKVSGRTVTVSPLEMTSDGGGRLSGFVVFEEADGAVNARAGGTAKGFRLGLAVADDQDPATFPAWDFDLELTASGRTQHELAASADGKLDVIVGEGRILNSGLDLVFSDFLTELFSKLNPFAEETAYTRLECGVAKVQFDAGVATVDPLIFQTDKIVASSAGVIDLERETIDIGFNTRPRRGIGISPGVVINPFIKLGGTMLKPSLALDPQGVAVTGGAAVATGGLSLLGQSLFNRFFREGDPCGKVVAELRRMRADDDAGSATSQPP